MPYPAFSRKYCSLRDLQASILFSRFALAFLMGLGGIGIGITEKILGLGGSNMAYRAIRDCSRFKRSTAVMRG